MEDGPTQNRTRSLDSHAAEEQYANARVTLKRLSL